MVKGWRIGIVMGVIACFIGTDSVRLLALAPQSLPLMPAVALLQQAQRWDDQLAVGWVGADLAAKNEFVRQLAGERPEEIQFKTQSLLGLLADRSLSVDVRGQLLELVMDIFTLTRDEVVLGMVEKALVGQEWEEDLESLSQMLRRRAAALVVEPLLKHHYQGLMYRDEPLVRRKLAILGQDNVLKLFPPNRPQTATPYFSALRYVWALDGVFNQMAASLRADLHLKLSKSSLDVTTVGQWVNAIVQMSMLLSALGYYPQVQEFIDRLKQSKTLEQFVQAKQELLGLKQRAFLEAIIPYILMRRESAHMRYRQDQQAVVWERVQRELDTQYGLVLNKALLEAIDQRRTGTGTAIPAAEKQRLQERLRQRASAAVAEKSPGAEGIDNPLYMSHRQSRAEAEAQAEAATGKKKSVKPVKSKGGLGIVVGEEVQEGGLLGANLLQVGIGHDYRSREEMQYALGAGGTSAGQQEEEALYQSLEESLQDKRKREASGADVYEPLVQTFVGDTLGSVDSYAHYLGGGDSLENPLYMANWQQGPSIYAGAQENTQASTKLYGSQKGVSGSMNPAAHEGTYSEIVLPPGYRLSPRSTVSSSASAAKAPAKGIETPEKEVAYDSVDQIIVNWLLSLEAEKNNLSTWLAMEGQVYIPLLVAKLIMLIKKQSLSLDARARLLELLFDAIVSANFRHLEQIEAPVKELLNVKNCQKNFGDLTILPLLLAQHVRAMVEVLYRAVPWRPNRYKVILKRLELVLPSDWEPATAVYFAKNFLGLSLDSRGLIPDEKVNTREDYFTRLMERIWRFQHAEYQEKIGRWGEDIRTTMAKYGYAQDHPFVLDFEHSTRLLGITDRPLVTLVALEKLKEVADKKGDARDLPRKEALNRMDREFSKEIFRVMVPYLLTMRLALSLSEAQAQVFDRRVRQEFGDIMDWDYWIRFIHRWWPAPAVRGDVSQVIRELEQANQAYEDRQERLKQEQEAEAKKKSKKKKAPTVKSNLYRGGSLFEQYAQVPAAQAAATGTDIEDYEVPVVWKDQLRDENAYITLSFLPEGEAPTLVFQGSGQRGKKDKKKPEPKPALAQGERAARELTSPLGDDAYITPEQVRAHVNGSKPPRVTRRSDLQAVSSLGGLRVMEEAVEAGAPESLDPMQDTRRDHPAYALLRKALAHVTGEHAADYELSGRAQEVQQVVEQAQIRINPQSKALSATLGQAGAVTFVFHPLLLELASSPESDAQQAALMEVVREILLAMHLNSGQAVSSAVELAIYAMALKQIAFNPQEAYHSVQGLLMSFEGQNYIEFLQQVQALVAKNTSVLAISTQPLEELEGALASQRAVINGLREYARIAYAA